MTRDAVPRILLVGAGHFGLQHLAEWRRLEDEERARLAGVVVRSPESRAALEAQGVPNVHAGFDESLLAGVDAVDIATPSATHADLARRCLAHVHVLVEKPLALDPEEAARLAGQASASGRVLMVGHLYRYHPVLRELKRLVESIPERPSGIEGVMTNPAVEAGPRHADPNLEFLHLFDIVDFLFGDEPEINLGQRRGNVLQVSVRYPGPMNVNLRMGWSGDSRVRVLRLNYSDRQIAVDFNDNAIVVSTRNNQMDKRFFPGPPQALREVLVAFLDGIGRRTSPPLADARIGERMVRVALGAAPRPPKDRPRVAVIGGGIFGATCALELAKSARVTLFERHAELLTEVSFANQVRHHSGFHYPRSYDTIQEIRASKREFEAEYEEAINRDIPAYFCTSASGIEIPAERYLAACMNNNLAFTVEKPPEGVVDPATVSLTLRTDEAVYDIPKMRRIVTERLRRHAAIEFRPGTQVVSGVMASDGTKRLTFEGPEGTREETFDFLINATFANRNLMARWFGFPVEPLRFDLYELLVLKLPIPQVCVTIIDGPFTSLVGTGTEGEFLLSHIHDSVSHSVIPDDGMPPRWGEPPTNRDNMLRHSSKYFPILKQATHVGSRRATRAVNAYARDFDARPTVITSHGFGCWSVLGGKIITCVSNAREIMRDMLGDGGRATSAAARARAAAGSD